MKIFNEIKNNKACPAKLQRSGGFVILFAVTLSAILLSIALGVANIALREVKFGTNARDTNDAFFAADTGAECASFNDKSDQAKFPKLGPANNISCVNTTITPTYSGNIHSFTVTGLGITGAGCAKVTVDKRTIPIIITSNGYNNGSGGSSPSWTCNPGLNTVERQVELRYGS